MKFALALGDVTLRDQTFHSISNAASSTVFTAIGMTIGQRLSALECGISIDQIPKRFRDAGLRISELTRAPRQRAGG